MEVNNINIETYGAFLSKFIRGIRRKSTEISLIKKRYQKLDEEVQGFNFNLEIGFKADTKELLEVNISKFTKQLQDCTIKETGYKIIYEAILLSEDIGEYSYDTLEDKEMAVVNYTLFCIDKFEQEKVVSFTSSTNINLESTMETPARLEITPTIALVDVTITGLGGAITIKNLSASKTIVIEDGLVLEQGINKFKDYDSWIDSPFLVPGINRITVDKGSCNVKIKYNPRWI